VTFCGMTSGGDNLELKLRSESQSFHIRGDVAIFH